ncbi:MAG: NUDIX hydrolase [Rhodobacteraceae bacterium]|nr:NUDIX hydrolase [Paracoccaceae bacterium]
MPDPVHGGGAAAEAAEAAAAAGAAPVRDAATVILWRAGREGPAVLMGQRGAGAAFMPSKFVFPGGAVDPADAAAPLAAPADPVSTRRAGPGPFAATAIRELWEETGLRLACPCADDPRPVPPAWRGFTRDGLRPDASALTFVFRAITPPGRTRRFDARFFLAPAAAVAGDPDDFSRATDELSHLHWVGLAEARALDLPFITEIVLAEIAPLITSGEGPARVPFFDNSGPQPAFRWID